MISVNGAIVIVAGLFLTTLWVWMVIKRDALTFWAGRQLQRRRWRKYLGSR